MTNNKSKTVQPEITTETLETKELEPKVSPVIDQALKKFDELETKYEELKTNLEESRKDSITVLGVFASFFIFISIEFQILRTLSNIWLLLGFSSFLLSGLLLFALVLTSIVRNKLQWKDFKNPVFVLILLLFLITVVFFFIYANDP